MVRIREENKNDLIRIREINDIAFNQPQEGRVVDKIRASGSNVLSLVAEIETTIVGHIFYSDAIIESNGNVIHGMGLAPMAVLPDYQNQGIGALLITESLKILANKNVPFVIVLGHESYYPKFGFEIASKYHVKCQWDDVPDEAFMIMLIDKEIEPKIQGVARYRDEWNEAM